MEQPKTYTAFGPAQVAAPTPMWVKRTVAICMVIISAFNGWVFATTLIPDTAKTEVILLTGFLQTIIVGVAPMFGIKVKDKQ